MQFATLFPVIAVGFSCIEMKNKRDKKNEKKDF